MQVDLNRWVLAIVGLWEVLGSLDVHLVALVLDAAQFHADRRSVWRSELQLCCFPLAAATIFLCHCACEDRGHVAVGSLLDGVGGHSQDGAVEELDELLTSATQGEVLKDERSQNHLLVGKLGQEVLATVNGHQSGASCRDGRHGEAACVRTPLGLTLPCSSIGLRALPLLVLLVFPVGRAGPLFLLDLVLLLLLLGPRPLALDALALHALALDAFALDTLSLHALALHRERIHVVWHLALQALVLHLALHIVCGTLTLDAFGLHALRLDALTLD
mmetsp:Transcript_67489/g.121638  ORF Transcript_67489/g.121638 Transcript_67489/m.121638 type:complete len:275 (+) Transcript_67489:857-1681(+)